MCDRYPFSGLPIEQVLIAAHLCWLRGDRRCEAALFISAGCKTGPGLVPDLKPLVSRLRYTSQVVQIRSPVFQGFSRITTLAHSDEPYVQKYGKFMETRFHELEGESKMRLLKNHSRTSERREYEADEERQEKRERRGPFRKRQEKRRRKPPPDHLKRGGGARVCRRKSRKPKYGSATTLARGARRNFTTEKRKQYVIQSCATVGVAKVPRSPPAPRGGGIGRT